MSYLTARMVEQIQKHVLLSPKVKKALELVDRADFVPDNWKQNAYSLDALPMSNSQWISSPLTVAIMTEALLNEGGENVLELGCGSGYQAMVLSHLFHRVFTIERIEKLLIEAKRRFHRLNAHNIFTKLADGQEGWTEFAPFDAIIFSACAKNIPSNLIQQLKPNGVLLAPMVIKESTQAICRFIKIGEQLSKPVVVTECSFVNVYDGIVRGANLSHIF
ncbi:MAG: protein-L-isoaspartate(D-aspartate) O-methyltransferase [Helicobacter sp.]|nr:protein-L-isoaspartate(D-aspartate) O-methyltransferase [Helicobacter sp.]MCI7485218.1 protein-L-isoaspartate(D-aspartate) O-methyltransferase [Helicobacter sp.]MDD7567036.1 protein-L-isoaspartate(D-aspartate) O-methyltransferase [Helicobacter sp.]MDY5740156.1 protein-L-isoaspartate(D-aspartate) O-methyltransferase [Helicobacter sp.]